MRNSRSDYELIVGRIRVVIYAARLSARINDNVDDDGGSCTKLVALPISFCLIQLTSFQRFENPGNYPAADRLLRPTVRTVDNGKKCWKQSKF